jgi:hypothetical protein
MLGIGTIQMDLGNFAASLQSFRRQSVLHSFNHIIIRFAKFIIPRIMEGIELTTIVVNQPPLEANSDSSPSSRPLDIASESEITEQALAPADGGPAAWRLLLAAFVFEALLWGNSLSEPGSNVLN